MAPHSSTLACKIPWTEEPGGLQSMGSLRVRHDWATSLSLFTSMHWRRKWQPIQCSCLENPRDGGAWWAAVYGVAQSRTRLKRLSSSSSSASVLAWRMKIPGTAEPGGLPSVGSQRVGHDCSHLAAATVQARNYTGGTTNLLLVLFNKILIQRPWPQQWQHFAVILMSMEAKNLTSMKISLLRIYSATERFTDTTRLSAHGVSPKDLDQWAQGASWSVSKSARPELLLGVLAREWVSPLALRFRGLKPRRAFSLSSALPVTPGSHIF